MRIKTTLVDEFNSQMEKVHKIEVGTEQQKIAVESATKLADRIIELEKLEVQRELEISRREIDESLKIDELRTDRRDKMIRNGVAIGGLVLAGVTAFITTKMELAGGMHTTEAGKSSIRQLLKFKS